MDEVFALAGRIYAEYCGAAKFVASYDAMLDWVATLPDLVLPSRFETEDVRADGTVVTRHEIVLVSVRLADGPRLVEMDGTSITMTPQIARMRQLTYEVALTGTYVYRRTRGVQSAYLTLYLVGDALAFTLARRRAAAESEADDASDSGSEASHATPSNASVADDEPRADEAVLAYVGDRTVRVEAPEEAQSAAEIRLAHAYESGAGVTGAMFESLVDAVRATSVAHGAPGVTADTVRAEIARRAHELGSVRSVAAVLRDIALRCATSATDIETAEETHEIPLGSIPLLVGSRLCTTRRRCAEGDAARAAECEMDRGGYFVLNGTERLVPITDRREPGSLLVYVKRQSKRVHVTGEVLSMCGTRSYTLYMRCVRPDARAPALDVHAQLPFARPVPVALLMRALGVESDRAIYERIVPPSARGTEVDRHLAAMLAAASVAPTQRDALRALSVRLVAGSVAACDRAAVLRRMIDTDFLPHVGNSVDSCDRKAWVLAHATWRVILVALELAPPDDRDGLESRVLEMCGTLFRRYVQHHVARTVPNEMRISIRRQVDNNRVAPQIQRTVSARRLGEVLRSAITTGRTADGCGISEVLSRTNAKATASMLARCNTSLNTEKTKQLAPRKLSASQYGYMCPFETPEGQSVGLVRNLTVLAFVATEPGVPRALWETVLRAVGMRAHAEAECKVMLDGAWVGSVEAAQAAARALRVARRGGAFSAQVSVGVIDGAVFLSTGAGRLLRPLFVVEGGRRLYDPDEHRDWPPDALVAAGVLEYIDARESISLLIATSEAELGSELGPWYTHVEIHPAFLFGGMVAGMPFPEHNQSPRNVYYAAMGKQSVGVATLNERMDTLAYRLHYPQVPLVSSRAEAIGGYPDVAGANPIVAIMTYAGFNQEDSVILNQSSIDRGFGHSTVLHTYRTEDRCMGGAHGEKLCHPEHEQGVARKKLQAYTKLDDDGLVVPGSRVIAQHDVLIGKVVPAEDGSFIDTSLVARCDGIVDRVLVTTSAEGRCIAKVRVRSYRQPDIGDKFASRHGQKGVCGMKYQQQDMPWTRDGVTPDLIMNPHAVPSRMTIGHMKEALLAKLAALTGKRGDGTAFMGQSVESISDALHACGMQRHGQEAMYSGATGQRLGYATFVGPGPYYQVLKHQVCDKLHSRARGPTQAVTRQPSAGRSHDGALRLGEMERDCLISHGAASLMVERLMHSSDASSAPVCRLCGFLGVRNDARGINHCRGCGGTECVEMVSIPYPTKALIQELFSLGIDLRLELK